MSDDLDPKEQFQKEAAERTAGNEPESQLWSGRYSHLAMIGTWALGAVATVGGLVVGLLANLGGNGWLAIVAAIALLWLGLTGLYAYRRWSVYYTLSDQRFVHSAGLLWRTVDRIELIDIDDVTYRQGPIERAFGVGTIEIVSSDRSTPELELPGIAEVREVADLIDDARRKERRSRSLHIEAV